MGTTKCSLARSVSALVLGVAFIVASLILWFQMDLPKNEAIWGIWLGLGCWAWAIVWEILVRASKVGQTVGQAAGLVVAVMALMVVGDYLTWERAGLYTLEAMAAISIIFGVVVWLVWVSEPDTSPTPMANQATDVPQATDQAPPAPAEAASADGPGP